MASSSTFNPLTTSDTHTLFSPFPSFISPKSSPTRSLSLPLKPFKFSDLSLSYYHHHHTISLTPTTVIGCVAHKEDVEVTDDDESESRWENEESEGEEDVVASENEVDETSSEIEEAKVFVGNLSYEIDSEQLAQIFSRAGVVEIAEVIYSRETNQSRGFAFVTMSTMEEAEKAVEMFHRYDINGRLLTVGKAASKGSASPERIGRVFDTTPRIYVGNLPWQVDDERIEQIFSEYGKVVDARVVYDRETGRSRGFGFVTMSTEAEVQNAIGALDGQSLEGRSIRVNVAESRPARSF